MSQGSTWAAQSVGLGKGLVVVRVRVLGVVVAAFPLAFAFGYWLAGVV